jgi:hypothetical protein
MTDTVTQADFQREERYIVIKRKHLSKEQEATLRRALAVNHIETVECVVVEADWPEYDLVWQMIEDRVTGRSGSTASSVGADAADLLAHYADFIRHSVKADELEAHPYLPEIERVVDDLRAATPAQEVDETERLRSMDSAPKDGRYIVAYYKSLDGYPEHLDGRAFVVRHEGITQSGYNLGWSLSPGHGGVPDKCFYGWTPLPDALAPEGDAR